MTGGSERVCCDEGPSVFKDVCDAVRGKGFQELEAVRNSDCQASSFFNRKPRVDWC